MPLFAFVIFLNACETRNTENAAPNQNKSEFNQNYKTEDNRNSASASGSAANNPASENSSVKSNESSGVEKDANDDKADFAGTAGIIDKKYEIKEVAVLKEVRAARHESYDRVVFEFAGAELPSYRIEYIDKPVRACGSGHVVPLKGDGWLEIRFTPAAAHTEEGKPTVKNREQSPNFKIVKEMKSTCDFEAEVAWVLGVASPNHYRVLELKNPVRLAIDIKHK